MARIVITDAAGRFVAAAEDSDGLGVPEGGTVAPAPADFHTQLATAEAAALAAGKPFDLLYRGGKVSAATRAKNASELDTDDRRDLASKLADALQNFDTLTPAQKDKALKLCLRAAVRATR